RGLQPQQQRRQVVELAEDGHDAWNEVERQRDVEDPGPERGLARRRDGRIGEQLLGQPQVARQARDRAAQPRQRVAPPTAGHADLAGRTGWARPFRAGPWPASRSGISGRRLLAAARIVLPLLRTVAPSGLTAPSAASVIAAAFGIPIRTRFWRI